ncbi:MAG: polyhydroxyalkanoate depolymerase, partial [Betaproteobacteria bacterium]
MLYHFQEFQRAMLEPVSSWAQTTAKAFTNKTNPLSFMPTSQRIAAGYELLYRLGKDYEKPEFGIKQIPAYGKKVAVTEYAEIEKPFCRLLRFKRFSDDINVIKAMKKDPVVLVVAPLSGHHSSLLRDCVRTLLQNHKVYLTDWTDARLVPLKDGNFHLDDYVRYIQEFIRHIGAEHLHVISVCQPTVPVLGAISLMATNGEVTPATMTMMGGPIDARKSPTAVNSLAVTKSYQWFENNVIFTVPTNHPGAGRKVYPGFLQHTGFIAMNPQNHMQSHWDFFQNLVRGDEQDTNS